MSAKNPARTGDPVGHPLVTQRVTPLVTRQDTPTGDPVGPTYQRETFRVFSEVTNQPEACELKVSRNRRESRQSPGRSRLLARYARSRFARRLLREDGRQEVEGLT
jgi:hypothetical protein